MNITANEYLGLAAAVTALDGLADDDPAYAREADYADRALMKVWDMVPPAQRRIVTERLEARNK